MLIDDLKKKNLFIETMLIPKMRRNGDSGYKSDQVARYLEDYLKLVKDLMAYYETTV